MILNLQSLNDTNRVKLILSDNFLRINHETEKELSLDNYKILEDMKNRADYSFTYNSEKNKTLFRNLKEIDMKHVQDFIDFLNDEVNLNQTRLNLLEERLDTISKYLQKSELLKKKFRCVKPQGSYAHKTIIEPQVSKEFDADILECIPLTNFL